MRLNPFKQRQHHGQLDDTIVASAARVNPSAADTADQMWKATQLWQQAAFGFYDSQGPAWFAAQFYSRALSKVRLFAAKRDDSGEIKELAETDWASQQLDRIKDPGGGRTALMTSFGRLMFLTGEGYLVASTVNGEEVWEFLSSSELRVAPGSGEYLRTRYPGTTPLLYRDAGADELVPPVEEKVVVAYRVWRRHPQYSWLPDSPMRAVLVDFETLTLLSLSVGARAKSRAAGQGILLRAQEISWGAPDGQNDDNPNVDRTGQRLQQAIVRPISQPGTAAGAAPIILEAPSEMIEKDAVLRHIPLSNPLEQYPEEGLRRELRESIAIGLDLPPEILLGMADANHWTAWQIDDQTWTAHLQPLVQQLCDDLSASFLRPLARQENQEDADELIVYYDAADVVSAPDKSGDAKDLYNAGGLSRKKYSEVLGFNPEEDMPDDEEHQEWLALQLRDASLLPTAVLPEETAGEAEPTAVAAERVTMTEPDPNAPVDPKALDGPPDMKASEVDANDTAITASISPLQEMIVAARMGVDRCREHAGSRLVTIARKPSGCPDCAERARELPNGLVASAFGYDQIVLLGATPEAVVAGGGRLFQQWLEREHRVPANVARRAALLLEKHAAQGLTAAAPDYGFSRPFLHLLEQIASLVAAA